MDKKECIESEKTHNENVVALPSAEPTIVEEILCETFADTDGCASEMQSSDSDEMTSSSDSTPDECEQNVQNTSCSLSNDDSYAINFMSYIDSLSQHAKLKAVLCMQTHGDLMAKSAVGVTKRKCKPSKKRRQVARLRRERLEFAKEKLALGEGTSKDPEIASIDISPDTENHIATDSLSKKCEKSHIGLGSVQEDNTDDKSAIITKEDLAVAITGKTTSILTKKQGHEISTQLTTIIIKMLDKRSENDTVPHFLKNPTFKYGVLRLWCEDEPTLQWLRTNIPKVKLPCGETLTIKRQADLKTMNCSGIFPGFWNVNQYEEVKQILRKQNPWVNINQWQRKAVNQGKNQLYITFSIPGYHVDKIVKHKMNLAFCLGSVEMII